jgi:hypothetical protein
MKTAQSPRPQSPVARRATDGRGDGHGEALAGKIALELVYEQLRGCEDIGDGTLDPALRDARQALTRACRLRPLV